MFIIRTRARLVRCKGAWSCLKDMTKPGSVSFLCGARRNIHFTPFAMNHLDRATTATLTGIYPGIGFNDFSFITATIRNEVYLACEKLYKAGYSTFICTLDSDYDLLAADRVILFREVKTPSVRLVAVLSHTRPPKRFGPAAIAKYMELCRDADEVVTLSRIRLSGITRNAFFLKHSSHILYMDDGVSCPPDPLIAEADKLGVPVTNLFNSIK